MQDTVQRLSRKGPLTPSATEGSHSGVKWIYQTSAKHTCPEDTETLSGLINTWTSTDIKPGLPVRLRPTDEHLPRKSQLTSGQATSTDATALSLQLSYPGLPSTPQAPQAGITTLTHLEPVHQFQGLAVILVSLQDDIGQLVDDDVQGSLLLNRPAEVQLQGENNTGEELQYLSPPL